MDGSKEQLIEKYWRAYLATLPSDDENRPTKYQAWAFGNRPEMADALGELVRAGIKTATASLGWWYEQRAEPYPQVGDYSIILDGHGSPMCIIQTTELSMLAFDEVDSDHAYQEGEGDRSLTHWREVHWRFFSEECQELGREPDEKMPVLCEKFKLVYADITQADFHLIHANVAIPRAPLGDPLMSGFMDRVDEVDALAQESPGFIAQPALPDEGAVYPEPALLNVSIWDSVENLRTFTYAGRHAEGLERREEWFEQPDGPTYVLYWSPAGGTPTEAEIKERFDHLRQHGPTPYAFSFDHPYSVEEMLIFTGEDSSEGTI